MALTLGILKVSGSEDLPLPAYQSDGAAGFDLHAAVTSDLEIMVGEYQLVPCGIAVELPDGYELQVRPRSGLAARHGITILNSPGTIDSDFRGEIVAIVANFGKSDFLIRRGDRIAQAVLAKAPQATIIELSELGTTGRLGKGLGSTGV